MPAFRAADVKRPPEDELARIAADVPTFAGFFVEGGRLVAYVTDLGESNDVRQALDPVRYRDFELRAGGQRDGSIPGTLGLRIRYAQCHEHSVRTVVLHVGG